MIHSIRSSLVSFKTVTLRSELNILLADRAVDSTERQSRNGAGKSSVLEIIHFALGAHASDFFTASVLRDYTFTVNLDLPYGQVSVTRSGAEPSRNYIVPSTLTYPIAPKVQKKARRPYFDTKGWRDVLGVSLFGLDLVLEDETGAPSFRALIGYFVRRVGAGGIAEPHRAVRDQQVDSIQVNLSYLFDLDYTLPMRLQKVRDRERQLKELNKVAKSGLFGELLTSSAQLRPRIAELDHKVRHLSERLSAFRVLSAYEDIEEEVTTLRAQLRELAAEDLIDRDRRRQIEDAIAAELDVDDKHVAEVFSELSDLLNESIKRQLDEVTAFHRSVVKNRQATLTRELAETDGRIRERRETSERLDARRSGLVEKLDGSGALTDFTALQETLAEKRQELKDLRNAFDRVQALETGKAKLQAERKDIEIRIRDDHLHRADRLEHAALIVRELVAALYEDRRGDLVVDVTENGPIFKIIIDGDRSEGIARMEIWCFDMLLARLCSERETGPGFVVHDSHVFDGVDERQIAAALQIGLEYSRKYKFQYVVTMNSDVFDRLSLAGDVSKAVMDLRLSDDRSDGGLFGMIIEPYASELETSEDLGPLFES
jgi:uncharacterized protein YydD (DUF2326 family)